MCRLVHKYTGLVKGGAVGVGTRPFNNVHEGLSWLNNITNNGRPKRIHVRCNRWYKCAPRLWGGITAMLKRECPTK